MRPGDLVAFKDGLFGIKAPENLGIFLERQKRKKEFRVVLVTLKGVKEVRPEQVTARRFNVQVDPAADETEQVARLKQLIQEAKGGRLEEEAVGTEAGLDERRAWERLVNEVPDAEPPERLADHLADGAASKGDVRRMQELLERCRRPGVGFFEQVHRGRWRPLPLDAFKGFQRSMESAHRLRKRLVRIVQVADYSGEEWERLEGVPIEEARLDDEERTLFDHLAKGMAAYVLHDAWPDTATPPDTTVHTLEGQHYHRFLENLARDWTGVATASRSSVMVQFLVDAAGMTIQDAIRLIARRKVRAAPGFTWETPEEIERWSERYEEPSVLEARDPAAYRHRVDLRAMETYTIDPPDAKDFDDAISLEEQEDGSARLWVHIADVSHYVEKDSRLDHHARERATSVYLPTGVLPMLPSRLSDDLCSLREGVDRFGMSVRIDLDPDGRVTGADPTESVIRVDRNLSYAEADQAIADGKGLVARLGALADRMQTHRRGLAIETGELRIRFAEEEAHRAAQMEGLLDEGGQAGAAGDRSGDATAEGPPVDATSDDTSPAADTPEAFSVQIKHGTRATKMIETFMVAANEAVSRFVSEAEVAVPYRCHPLPERAKAERFEKQAYALGLDVRIDLPDEGPPTDDEPADADEKEEGGPSILDQLKGGKLQLGGFAASETVGSRKEDDEDEEDEGAEAPAPQTDLKPSIRGLAQLSEEEQAAWLAPFRAALEEVEKIEDDDLRELANQKVLSTLGRAFYTPRNLGHFGLGSPSYAHFTSPIRRYPDLVLHRQLRWVLRQRAGIEDAEEAPHLAEHLDLLTEHCSQQGESAERLERGLLDCCMTFESRKPDWSVALPAMVNGIASGGIFLSLPGNLEARLALRDLPGGPYETDEHGTILFRARLPGGAAAVPDDEDASALMGVDWRELEDPDTGELRDVRLRLGDRIRVQIRERDFVEGKVAVRLAGGM